MASLLSFFGCHSAWKGFENDTITSFSLSEGGGMNPFSGFGYYVKETKDGKVYFHFDEGLPTEKDFTIDDHSVFDSLQAIIAKHKMYTYHGHYQPPFDITDGKSWSLDVRYKSGHSIDAGGYMDGPSGYRDAFRDIAQCLDYWKNLPIPVNEVVNFIYEYGPERYVIERVDDRATLTYDNEETGDHQVFERGLEMLEDLRITFNTSRLKMNQTRSKLGEGCTPWMFDITYGDGDHYHYESSDCDYKCGYTYALQGFVSNWMKEEKERRPLNYYYY